ncbi:hypothetical protein ACX8Z9_13380 [Arthrobacter halodurans]|uniref:Abi-like protein n=1 Tax=Arthrobacter halodurans TaxID=516699 RepID=A0ABV4UQV9_9MICC
MAEVKYKRYRDYLRQRVATNDTMMGLLAGSKLASQTLTLTAGSRLRLKDIFPEVPHIERFNLTTEKARVVLNDAENLLGVLAVPQIMALHEDLMTGMLGLLELNSPGSTKSKDNVTASNLHEKFEAAANMTFTAASLQLFHLIRLARNEHIHNGGVVRQRFATAIAACSATSLRVWEDVTGEPFPAYRTGDRVKLGLPELIGTLALTKRLATEANEGLQPVLSASIWADLVAEEWKDPWVPGNPGQQDKRIQGIARKYYGAVNIKAAELADARKRIGNP